MKLRIGFGVDVHQLVSERKLILGGIEIPSDLGALGHSDADVLLHAICDALLGALNLRDIGFHFSDQDPKYKNIDSKILLKDTYQLIKQQGFKINNIDATIIAEKPKLNPHIPAMQSKLSGLINVEVDAVNVKATTTEKMGYTGRGEGISAHAVVLMQPQ